MASYRHLIRICLMQTIFAIEFKQQDSHIVLERILKEFAPKVEDLDFAYQSIDGVMKNRQEIFDIISRYAPEWPVEKIARIDRAILEVGIYEIAFSNEVPPVVAINEAIEIAKEYGDNSSPKFVNGVLSSVMKDYAK